jgi:proline dehydrogenase
MTRAFFLRLSQSVALRRWMEKSAWARKVTERFVAGEGVEDALTVASRFAAEGIMTTLDHLGENVTTVEEANSARDFYLKALAEIGTRRLPSTISLKLTALGLDVSEDAALANLRALAQKAAQIGSYVEIDMEDRRYTDRTIEFAQEIGIETRAIRVAIQAYLYRTPRDIDRMNHARVMVRLCKGAYIEPAGFAMPRKSDVDDAYESLSKKLLDEGTYPALATHDERMIGSALAHVRARQIPAEKFEFEMLHGIRRDLQRKLAADGHRVRVYVPYGAEWYRYFMRRLAERPANVWFVLRNLFR